MFMPRRAMLRQQPPAKGDGKRDGDWPGDVRKGDGAVALPAGAVQSRSQPCLAHERLVREQRQRHARQHRQQKLDWRQHRQAGDGDLRQHDEGKMNQIDPVRSLGEVARDRVVSAPGAGK